MTNNFKQTLPMVMQPGAREEDSNEAKDSAGKPGPKKFHWWYENIITWMILNPGGKLTDCAKFFGKSVPWMSMIVNSDVFKARLAERRQELNLEADELLLGKMRKVAGSAFDRIFERLEDENIEMSDRGLMEIASKTVSAINYSKPDSRFKQEPGTGKSVFRNPVHGGNQYPQQPQPQVNIQVVTSISPTALEEARAKIRMLEGRKIQESGGNLLPSSTDEEDKV